MIKEPLPFDITIKNDNNNETNILIKGDLSFVSVPDIYNRTKNCFENAKHIQVDLHDVQRTDSAAMALILEWHRLAKENNSQITLNNIPAMLKRIASVSDLEEFIPV